MNNVSLYAAVISALKDTNPPQTASGFGVTWAYDHGSARDQLILGDGNSLFPRDDGWMHHQAVLMPIDNAVIQKNPQGYLHLYLVRILKRINGLVYRTKIIFGYEVNGNDQPSEERIGYFKTVAENACPPDENWEYLVDTETRKLRVDPISNSRYN